MLKCYLDSRGSAYLRLHPVKVEEISVLPKILYFHNVVTPREINQLKKDAIDLVMMFICFINIIMMRFKHNYSCHNIFNYIR